MRYCKPLNAGLASETSAVARRIARLIDALDSELTAWIVEGAVIDDVRKFRGELLDKLQAEGWSFSYDGGNKLKARPPGHKKPYNMGTPRQRVRVFSVQ